MAKVQKNPTVQEMRSLSSEIDTNYKSDAKKQKLCLAITLLVIGLLAGAGVGAGTYLAFTGSTLAPGLAYAGVSAFLGIAILGVFALRTRSKIKEIRSQTVEAAVCFQFLNKSQATADEMVTMMKQWNQDYFDGFIQIVLNLNSEDPARAEIYQAMASCSDKLTAVNALNLLNKSGLTNGEMKLEIGKWEKEYFEGFVEAVRNSEDPARAEIYQAMFRCPDKLTAVNAINLLNKSGLTNGEMKLEIGKCEKEYFEGFVEAVQNSKVKVSQEIYEAILLNHNRLTPNFLMSDKFTPEFAKILLDRSEDFRNSKKVAIEDADRIVLYACDPNDENVKDAVGRRLQASTAESHAEDALIFARHWKLVVDHFAYQRSDKLVVDIFDGLLAKDRIVFLTELKKANSERFQTLLSTLLKQKDLQEEILKAISIDFPKEIAEITGADNGLTASQAEVPYNQMEENEQEIFLSSLNKNKEERDKFVKKHMTNLNQLFVDKDKYRYDNCKQGVGVVSYFERVENFEVLLEIVENLDPCFILELLKLPEETPLSHVKKLNDVQYVAALVELRKQVNTVDEKNVPDDLIRLCVAFASAKKSGVSRLNPPSRYTPLNDEGLEDKFQRIRKMPQSSQVIVKQS